MSASQASPLPFAVNDFQTRRYDLSAENFASVVPAWCSIPFVLNALHGIAGAAPGAYWAGGITDYHLHLDLRATCELDPKGVVLYPHFQRAVVPGWLDKSLQWRHDSKHFLDDVIVLAPSPHWVAALPNKKLPDRTDFARYGRGMKASVAVWQRAVAERARLRDESADWLAAGSPIFARACQNYCDR